MPRTSADWLDLNDDKEDSDVFDLDVGNHLSDLRVRTVLQFLEHVASIFFQVDQGFTTLLQSIFYIPYIAGKVYKDGEK